MVGQILSNNNESATEIFPKTFYSFALDIQRCGGPTNDIPNNAT
jgi:hypothetical protein